MVKPFCRPNVLDGENVLEAKLRPNGGQMRQTFWMVKTFRGPNVGQMEANGSGTRQTFWMVKTFRMPWLRALGAQAGNNTQSFWF